MAGKTVLITGRNGFIGSALMRKAAETREISVVGADRDEADLCDENAVFKLLDRIRPERIVHLAGTLIKGDEPDAVQKQWENTFIAGTNVIKAAVAQGTRQVIIPGTIDELGNQEGALGPDSLTRPRSAYGLCKGLLREFASYWAYRGAIRVDWFRPFVVYGPGQTRGQMLLPTAFRAAKSGVKAAFSDGVQRRDFIHVDDVAEWVLRALQVDLHGATGTFRVHHLGTGEGVEVRTVLETIARAFPGAQFDIGAIARRPGEPALEVSAPYVATEPPLDSWRPRVRWLEGVTQTCEWWRTYQDQLV